MKQNELAKWFLRIGLAFVFLYATFEIYVHPSNFLKYVPEVMLGIMPVDIFLSAFAVAEVGLAVWLLSGWKGEYPSLLAVLMMVGIVAFNMEYFNVLFRNVAIGFGGLALVVLELRKDKEVRSYPAKKLLELVQKNIAA